MIDLSVLDRSSRRGYLNTYINNYRVAKEIADALPVFDPGLERDYARKVNSVLASAHRNLPGFSAVMAKNVMTMRPEMAFERSVIALMSNPAKPSGPK